MKIFGIYRAPNKRVIRSCTISKNKVFPRNNRTTKRVSPIIENNIAFCCSCITACFFNLKIVFIKNNSLCTPELILHKLIPKFLTLIFVSHAGKF